MMRQDLRPAVDLPRQLERRDKAPGRRDGADHQGERRGDIGKGRAAFADELDRADERARKTADPVEERHDLRHLDHFHAGRPEKADRRAGRHRKPEIRIEERFLNTAVHEGQKDRKPHHADADKIPAGRGLHLALHRKAGKDRRGENAGKNIIEDRAHFFSSLLSFLRNIISMRWVTEKPPATLIMASAAAITATISSPADFSA